MNAQNFCLVFGVLISSSSLSIVSADPTATFEPPSFFAIGSQFVTGCTLGDFDSTAIHGYEIDFYLNSSDSTANPTQDPHLIASWIVANYTDTGPAYDFIGYNLEAMYGVITTEGDMHTFPNYQVKIEPKNVKAQGIYYCTLELYANDSFVNTTITKSNEWDSRDAISPLVTLTPPESISIDSEFTLKCSISGFTTSSNFTYSVSYYLNAPDSPNYTFFALYAIANNTVVFIGPNHESQLGIVTFEGDIKEFPDFEIKILPKNTKAKGKYQCSLTVILDDPTDMSPPEFKSNEWTATLSTYSPTFSVALSNGSNSIVGKAFSSSCNVNVSTGYDEAFYVYYVFTVDNLSNKSLASWFFDPLTNQTVFTSFQTVLSVDGSPGEVNFPSFEAIFTPTSVEASGLYRCFFMSVINLLNEQHSPEVYVEIVADGGNGASTSRVKFSIYFIILFSFFLSLFSFR